MFVTFSGITGCETRKPSRYFLCPTAEALTSGRKESCVTECWSLRRSCCWRRVLRIRRALFQRRRKSRESCGRSMTYGMGNCWVPTTSRNRPKHNEFQLRAHPMPFIQLLSLLHPHPRESRLAPPHHMTTSTIILKDTKSLEYPVRTLSILFGWLSNGFRPIGTRLIVLFVTNRTQSARTLLTKASVGQDATSVLCHTPATSTWMLTQPTRHRSPATSVRTSHSHLIRGRSGSRYLETSFMSMMASVVTEQAAAQRCSGLEAHLLATRATHKYGTSLLIRIRISVSLTSFGTGATMVRTGPGR